MPNLIKIRLIVSKLQITDEHAILCMSSLRIKTYKGTPKSSYKTVSEQQPRATTEGRVISSLHPEAC